MDPQLAQCKWDRVEIKRHINGPRAGKEFSHTHALKSGNIAHSQMTADEYVGSKVQYQDVAKRTRICIQWDLKR